MSTIMTIEDLAALRAIPAAIPAIPGTIALENVNGTLQQVDDQGNASAIGGGAACPFTLIQTQLVPADTNTVNFAGLAGETDGIYFFAFDGVAGAGALITDFISINPNGLTTNLHCNGQYAQGWSSTTNNVIGSGAGSNAWACTGVPAGEAWTLTGYFFPKSGKNRLYNCRFTQSSATDANNRNGYFNGMWANTPTPLTSLPFVSQHNTFGAGTRASLYKF